MVKEPPQFSVCENRGVAAAMIPYLLCLQHPFAAKLSTRLVAPVEPRQNGVVAAIPRTLIELEIEGAAFVAILPEMSAVRRDDIGAAVGTAEGKHTEIIKGIDFLLNGY